MFRFLYWRSLFRRKRFEAEMAEEFAFHRERRIQDLIQKGLPSEEAARRAGMEFGGAQRYGEECREAHRLHWLDELGRDLRYAFRTLSKSPVFVATAIVSLALGIGMNTLIFSVFESLLLRPLPIAQPDRVVFVETKSGISHSFPNYREFRDNNSTFSGLAGYRISPMSLENGEGPQRVWGYLATGNYFDLLGIKPALGKFFHQADDLRVGASPYAVLSFNTWQAHFGADSRIAGKTVRINGLPYTILGVAPRGFHGTELFYWPELWVPMTMQPQIEVGNPWLDNRHTWDTWIFGRLKPGTTLPQAAADLNRTANDLARRFPDSDVGLQIKFSQLGFMGSAMRGPIQLFVKGLLLLVALVLLTACLNLAGLMLARSVDRQREMAIRSSIGASRSRIIRQVLTESLLLALLGGLAGWALAAILCKLLSLWHAPMDFPVQFEVSPDGRVLIFTAIASLVTGVLFGLGPALHLSKADLNGLLKGGMGVVILKRRFRFALRDLSVAAEVALCFVLVFGSLLAVRGLQNVLKMPLGFDPEGVTTAAFDLGSAGYSEAQGRALQKRILSAVRELPGIASAAYGNSLPLSIDQSNTGVQAEDEPVERGRKAKSANFYQVSPGYLSTLGISLLDGRDFDEHDNSHSPQVAIVNQTFAKLIMHTTNPVGKAFRHAFGGPRVQVIGLVEDGKYVSLTESPKPVVFWPIYQRYNSTTTLVVKSRRPPAEVARQIRQLVAKMDSRLPLYGVGSLQNMLGFALFPMHAAAVALSAFGLLAVVLAVTGIHGLSAYAVSRRTRELGIRIALGARSLEILRSVLAKMAALVTVGLVIGAVLAFAAGQVLGSVIYGASPKSPGVFLSVFVSLLGIAVLSCWRPAMRALRTDPTSALRYE
jgi:predicted permease